MLIKRSNSNAAKVPSLSRELAHNRLRIAQFPTNAPVTIIDTGCDQGYVGQGWTPVHRYSHSMPDHNQVNRPVVDAVATFVSCAGTRKRTHLVKVCQVLWTPKERESLIPPDQMMWHGLTVDTRSAHFGGQQHIQGDGFTIPLYWDGKTMFVPHVKAKLSDKILPRCVLTSNLPYRPQEYAFRAAASAAIDDNDIKLSDTLSAPEEPEDIDLAIAEMQVAKLYLAPSEQLATPQDSLPPVRVRRRYHWDAQSYLWQPHQLTEWQRRLGYPSIETVKETFKATTQMVPSVRHENEMFPKESQKARIPFYMNRRLKEIVYADPVEFPMGPNDRVKTYGLLFYTGKSRVLAIYKLGTDQSAAKILEYMYEFVRDFGCPTTFASDFANNLAKGAKWQRFARLTCTIVRASEGGKHNSNLVERAWQDLQKRGHYIQNQLKIPAHQKFNLYQHLCDLNNHTACDNLNWRTPLEVMSGDTPDISIF